MHTSSPSATDNITLEEFSPDWGTAHESSSITFALDGDSGAQGALSMGGGGPSGAGLPAARPGFVTVSDMPSCASAARMFVDSLMVPPGAWLLLTSRLELWKKMRLRFHRSRFGKCRCYN